jgi:hypothetical protein
VNRAKIRVSKLRFPSWLKKPTVRGAHETAQSSDH